ncbi:hypothetical protein ACKGJO_12670 [Gracilimonas sp. Q87]|uniref:hypothetical protein n=1 Tax=Gracilimonas sp. Q87 TaxID=3384766 RepID=UPI003983F24C
MVDLKALDYAFAMPPEIPSGWITFRMENMGEDNHIATILRSESDLSVEEIQYKISTGNYDFPTSSIGGPGLHSSGQKSDVTLHLEPGNYVMICWVMIEGGKFHADLGMQMVFQVTEASSGATKPKADVNIILDKYDLQRTKTFATGEQTVEIVNRGFPYGLHLFRVQDSLSIEKAELKMDGIIGGEQVEWISGAEPPDSVRSTFVTYSFSPGEYMWTSHAYVWGVMDRFIIEKGERTNKLIEQEKKSKANKVGVKVEDREIRIDNDIKTGRNTFYYAYKGNDKHLFRLTRIKKEESKKSFLNFYELAPEDRYFGSVPYLGWPVDLSEEDPITVDIQPGKYLIDCHARSENGEKHRDQGEIAEFVVE